MLIEILHKLVEQRYRRHGFKSKLLDVAPFRMHYYERRDSNSSKYLLFLHGLGTSSSTWVRTIPKLPQEWNILALDLPGFGMSSVDDVKSVPQFEELYQSVVLFVERMVPVPFTLVGQSLGGWLAATFAARHSQLVRHLILVNNAGIFCDGATEQKALFQTKSVRDVRRLLDTLWFRYPWYFKPFYQAILKDLLKRRVPEFTQTLGQDHAVNNELGELTMIVDIIWGREDRLLSMESIEIMQRSIPHARVHFIEQCGHVPQLERRNEFTAILRELLHDREAPNLTAATESQNRRARGLA